MIIANVEPNYLSNTEAIASGVEIDSIVCR